jgi:hypothetical protein
MTEEEEEEEKKRNMAAHYVSSFYIKEEDGHMGRLCVWASLGSERHDQYFSFQLLAGHQ